MLCSAWGLGCPGVSWGWTFPLTCSSDCGWDGTVRTKWLSLGDITELPPSAIRAAGWHSLCPSVRAHGEQPSLPWQH